MVMDNIIIIIIKNILEIMYKGKSKDLEYIIKIIRKYIKDYGKMEKCMDLESNT